VLSGHVRFCALLSIAIDGSFLSPHLQIDKASVGDSRTSSTEMVSDCLKCFVSFLVLVYLPTIHRYSILHLSSLYVVNISKYSWAVGFIDLRRLYGSKCIHRNMSPGKSHLLDIN